MGFRKRAARLLVTLITPSIAVTGCAVLGPASIKNGRAAYNDAIISTNNQQVLAMIVRMRYGEPSGLLAVSSVTANLHIQTTAGSEFGIGPDSNFEGNLTPLSAGIAYEENPTISYVPVQGEKYLRQFLSPLPLDLTVLLLATLGNSPNAMTLLCKSINGIRNPDFLFDASVEPDPRFARVAKLLTELNRGGHLTWAPEAGRASSFRLTLNGEGATYAQQVGELYGLLGFAAPRDLDAVITLPVFLGIGKPSQAAIQLRTRSLYDLFSIAAASVEVPEEHLQSGLAVPLPPPGAAGRNIQIRGSKRCPGGAMIAVKHHGWWYSIDGTDTESKLTFRVLEALMEVRMAEAAGQKAAPVLTVPVSR
jgi:hypothetical protein